MARKRKNICAVVPAAGRGSRLGKDIPKILIPITRGKTVWHILREKLKPVVGYIHVVLSPAGVSLFKQQLKRDGIRSGVSTSVQEIPRGMGDAIFGAVDYWKEYDNILIVWGDQVFVSAETIRETVKTQLSLTDVGLTIPINSVTRPYVQYIFDDNFSRLIKVRETREGDVCNGRGFADVGIFCLSTVGLMDIWQGFLKKAPRGKETGEVNFLPFLPYLSTEFCWQTRIVMVKDPVESRGINTPRDVVFFEKKFESLN